jgi:hypothetical protein
MEEKQPFTEQEEAIMKLIVEAHNQYCKLEPIHSSDGIDWMNAIHALQNVLIYRCVKRDYPKYFK